LCLRLQHAGHLPGRAPDRPQRRRPPATPILSGAAATSSPKRPPGSSTGHRSGHGV